MVPGLEAMGIRMLLNESEVIERGDQAIHLAGVDDAHYYCFDNLHRAGDEGQQRLGNLVETERPAARRERKAPLDEARQEIARHGEPARGEADQRRGEARCRDGQDDSAQGRGGPEVRAAAVRPPRWRRPAVDELGQQAQTGCT